jgi:hypothetical protein
MISGSMISGSTISGSTISDSLVFFSPNFSWLLKPSFGRRIQFDSARLHARPARCS